MDEHRKSSVPLEELMSAAKLRLQRSYGTGISGLLQNRKVFLIALFASFGGLEHGYQQGVIPQRLVMTSFKTKFSSITDNTGATGWLTSILQLGGWAGVLSAGVFAEVFTRRHTVFSGALWIILGPFLAAGAHVGAYLYAGRFFTGFGVGTLSIVGPLDNAELAPPKMRRFLVALQQLSTTPGIMISYWISYGTNYIGGTGKGQSDWAWRIPLLIQDIPAIILAIGVIFILPFSPRMLVNRGQVLFEQRLFAQRFPHLARGKSIWRCEFAQNTNSFRTKDNFKRVATAGLIIFFQQWSGIDSIIYYASSIFQTLGLTAGTISLLATGVVGVINVIVIIPAIVIIDKVGRKPLLMAGSAGMFCSMVIVATIVADFEHDRPQHAAAVWVAVVFIWLYIANFVYSWGPTSWVLIADFFPLSIRAKGTSIGASSNWTKNFIVAFIVPPMIASWNCGVYLFFALWLFISALFVWFFVHETKNKTLEEMDLAFDSVMATTDKETFAQAKEEVGLTRLLQSDGESLASKHDSLGGLNHLEEGNPYSEKAGMYASPS